MKSLKEDRDMSVRQAYLDKARSLAPMTDEEVQALIRMSSDPAPEAREKACFLLGDLCAAQGCDSSARREALAARLDDSHIPARVSAILGLAASKDRRVIAALAWTLMECAEAFESRGDAHQDARGASESEQRAKTYKRDCMNAKEILIKAASYLPDRVYSDALQRLNRLAFSEQGRDALAQCDALAAQEPMLVRLDDPEMLRDWRKLGDALPGATAGDLLKGLLAAGKNTSAAEQILCECLQRPEEDIVKAAECWLRDSDPKKRATAALALSREGDGKTPAPPAIVEMLLQLAEDERPEVAIAALHALGARTRRIFDADARGRLRVIEKRPEDAVRLAYARMQRSPYVSDPEVRNDADLDAWVRLTRDPAPDVRAEACAHLLCCALSQNCEVRIDTSDALRALADRFDDADRRTRSFAISAAGCLGDARAIAAAETHLEADVSRMPHMTEEELADVSAWHLFILRSITCRQMAPALKTWEHHVNVSRLGFDEISHIVAPINDLICACKAA